MRISRPAQSITCRRMEAVEIQIEQDVTDIEEESSSLRLDLFNQTKTASDQSIRIQENLLHQSSSLHPAFRSAFVC